MFISFWKKSIAVSKIEQSQFMNNYINGIHKSGNKSKQWIGMNYISPHRRHSFPPQPHHQNKTLKYTLHPINQRLHFSSGYLDPSRVSCRILNTVGSVLYWIVKDVSSGKYFFIYKGQPLVILTKSCFRGQLINQK